MRAMPKPRIVALVAGLLLALNVALAIAQSGHAFPATFVGKLLGPNMVRAEILWRSGGVQHDYLLDNGRVRNVSAGSLTIVEKDGKVVTVTVAADAEVTFKGSPVLLTSLRRGVRAVTYRDGNASAYKVEAFPK
jgi:hypothetical protein